jgi:mannose-1-phosphate guanylyltransferase/mannose-6-phosphate isomerase
MSKIQPIILSGGAGTRLWPISRPATPKQFVNLLGTQPLFQQAIARAQSIPGALLPWVICNEDHRFLVAEQARHAGGVERIILEPIARNTAPAITAAALMAAPDTILIVLPADHVIVNQAAFLSATQQAIAVAQTGALATFGIMPTMPETGYGYIRLGQSIDTIPGAYRIAQFLEKPSRAAAEAMINAGGYVWNSGMFVMTAQRLLEEMQTYQPEVLRACQSAIDHQVVDHDFVRLDARAFAKSPAISMDYAVMEHTRHATVVPVDMGWADLGTWQSLWQHSPQDEHGNVIRGSVIAEDVKNSYICSTDALVAVTGCDDLVVVALPDLVMVAPRAHSQAVQKLAQVVQTAQDTPAVSAPRLPDFAATRPIIKQSQGGTE